jgi:pyrroloquinoline quinone biosynthesis protein B
VQIRILGSAAGGGVPQWNCNCSNCRDARKKRLYSSQSSAAVSDDGKQWLLLNASPDLPYQFASFAALAPQAAHLRGTAVAAVILTDGEMDHVAGLLSLREQKSMRIVCTKAVKQLLTSEFPLLRVLGNYCRIGWSGFPLDLAGIRVWAFEFEVQKSPRYSEHLARQGGVTALRLEGARSKRSLVYIPGLPAISEKLDHFVAGCSCLIVDGTFWSEREMISMGLSRRTSCDMGHVPMSGRNGTLEWLRRLDVPRKIYTHINNSNPILRPGSPERRIIEKAGIEISSDGMKIAL